MAATFEWLRLAEFLAARLCHDFSGLIGTVGGAIELASEAHPESEALLLAADAARELVGRVRLYRAAWANQATDVTIASLHELSRHLPRVGSISIRTDGIPESAVLPRPMGVVALNLVMLSPQTLPKGGQVVISGTPNALRFRLLGEDARWPVGFDDCARNPERAVRAAHAPRDIQMPLTALFAHGLGVELSLPFGAVPPEARASYQPVSVPSHGSAKGTVRDPA